MRSDDSFVELYHTTYYAVYRYVRANTFDQNLIEDIIQETYKTAFMKQEMLNEHENVAGWLMLTAKYKMLKMQSIESKHSNAQVELDEQMMGENVYGGEDEIRVLEWKAVLETELSQEERQLVFDYYMDGYTYRELAKMYNVSSSCLKMRLKRIREKLILCI